MKLTMALVILITMGVGLSTVGVASGVGATVGFEPTGLWLIGALTELSVGDFIDLRAQIGFATQEIEGLMLGTLSILPHWALPPVDPFLGVGIGVALTPPPFSTGLLLEGSAGVRLVPHDIVSILLQVRYLLRYTEGVWTTGPVFEGGILINF